jgi:hypothetical protein
MTKPDDITELILFNDILPLPFRVLLLIQIGGAMWLLINHVCFREHINILQLLNLSYSSLSYGSLTQSTTSLLGEQRTLLAADFNENKTLMAGIWQNLKRTTGFNTTAWVLFKLIQKQFMNTESPNEVIKVIYYTIPLAAFAYTFFTLFIATSTLATPGQVRMFTTIKRVLTGGINSKSMRSNDILISDSLISYAKVINDFVLFIWVYYINETYNPVVELVVLAIPACIRMKQCWYEYNLTGQKQHLYNLVKYLTSVFPLSVNYIIKIYIINNPENLLEVILRLNKWWAFFSFVNSSYSYYWDIKMDWGFEMFDGIFRKKSPLSITRPSRKLAFSQNAVYYFAIVADFVLRFLWVLKVFIIKQEFSDDDWSYVRIISTFLYGYDVYSLGYTVIEFLEIYRRWIWCFIKLENDWVKLQAVDQLEMVDIKTS